VSITYPSIANISFPEAFPWGVSLISKDKGVLLYANEHMQRYYVGTAWDVAAMDEKFVFPKGLGFADVVKQLSAAHSWSGRVVPYQNKHGIASVELLLQQDLEDANRVWLYTMEHPSIDGALRFSSRSELQILRVLLDNTLEYVFFRDTEGHFIITNQAFSAAVATDELSSPLGLTIAAFVSQESACWVDEVDRQVYDSGLPSVNNVSRFTFNNGTKHWLQMTTVPVRSGSGEIVGSVSVARDICDLKRTESDLLAAIKEAEDASRAKGEFLAAMSHEIRTPINGIIGASELCQETQLDAEQRGYADTVVQCGNTLLSLVNDVLDFSKIEAGQLKLETLSFNLATLMEDVAHEFTQIARQKQVELIVSNDNKLPHYLMGDPMRLKQIIYNLLGNAVKFTEAGEIVLRAEALDCADGGARVRLSVADTGVGIPPSRLDAIFLSFTQADMSTTRRYGGTGLGLTICKELVDLMGGSIQVESELGKGATFTLDVPLEESITPGVESIPYHPELAGLHVLIVDDNATNRDSYQQMCNGWGYRSAIAREGVEALAMLEEACRADDPYKLVLLDQQMPGLTGLDLASLVMSRLELKETKMLLLSSSLSRAEMERVEQLGLARALSKPVKRGALIEVILETFDVGGARMPVADASHALSIENADSLPEMVGSLDERLNVLLAEDNLVNQQIACRRLEKLGHQVVIVPDGQQAVDLVMSKHFDCVLMDVQMPVMDGSEATREIRRLEADRERPSTFIVAMTAHAMKGDEEMFLANGMDEYISKPFRVQRLREVLEVAKSYKRDLADAIHSALELSFSQRLDEMGEEDREDVLSVAGILSDTLPKDLYKLECALRERNWKQICFMAHSLKGVAGVFGASKTVSLAIELEAVSRRGDLLAVREVAGRFVHELRVLLGEVEIELKKRSMSSDAC
jgi:two-component system sensor histidine kinase/response regulator